MGLQERPLERGVGGELITLRARDRERQISDRVCLVFSDHSGCWVKNRLGGVGGTDKRWKSVRLLPWSPRGLTCPASPGPLCPVLSLFPHCRSYRFRGDGSIGLSASSHSLGKASLSSQLHLPLTPLTCPLGHLSLMPSYWLFPLYLPLPTSCLAQPGMPSHPPRPVLVPSPLYPRLGASP